MKSFIFLCLCVLISSCRNESSLENDSLAGKGETITFDHLCSEADRNDGVYRQSYALFEAADSLKALALGVVSVGWMISAWDSEKRARGISLDLVNMRLESLPEWSGDKFSLALKMQNVRTGQAATGEKKLQYSLVGRGQEKDYQMSNEGSFLWEDDEYKYAGLSINENQISHPEDTHVLILVIENVRTGDVMEWEGPSLNLLVQLWESTNPPEYRDRGLGLYEPLVDPAQEGGLFDSIKDGWFYDGCFDLREHVKREFDSQFEQLKRQN